MPQNLDPSQFPRIQVRKTLLVIDAQNDFLSRDGLLAVQDCDKLSSEIAHLVSRFRLIGDVVWIRSEFKTPRKLTAEHIITSASEPATARSSDVDREAFLTHEFDKRPCVAPGTSACDMPNVLKEVLDKATDTVITKSHYSAFRETGLVQRLRRHIAFELYLCGSLANIGIFATAVDATPHGTTVNIIEDCCGWREEDRLRLAFEKLDRIYACRLMKSENLFRDTLPIANLSKYGSPVGKPTSSPRPRVRRSTDRPPKRSSTKSESKTQISLEKTMDLTETLQNLSLEPSTGAPDSEEFKVKLEHGVQVSQTSAEFQALLEPAVKTLLEDIDKAKRPEDVGPAKQSEEPAKTELSEPMKKIKSSGDAEKPDVPEDSEKTEPSNPPLDLKTPSPTSKNPETPALETTTKADPSKNSSVDELTTMLSGVAIKAKEDATIEDPQTASNSPDSPLPGNSPKESPLPPDKKASSDSPQPLKITASPSEDKPVLPETPVPTVVSSIETGDTRNHNEENAPKSEAITRPEAVGSDAPDLNTVKLDTTKPEANAIETNPSPKKPPKKISPASPHQPLLRLCEGDTTVIPNVLDPAFADEAFETLKEEVQWAAMTHRSSEVPRRIAVQGAVADDGSKPLYRHPADESPPLRPFSPTVLKLKAAVEAHLGHRVNHVLIQYYRTGHDYISEHSDKTLDIARTSYIANLSLGAQRTMVFRTKRIEATSTSGDANASTNANAGPPRQIERAALPHNSLLRMGQYTNKRWLHGIKPDKRAPRDKDAPAAAFAGARISLTFRLIATFLSADDTRIWGQGATCKTAADGGAAAAVVVGDCARAEKLVAAFGRENRDPWFDWDEVYGQGSDVLHMKLDPGPGQALSGNGGGDEKSRCGKGGDEGTDDKVDAAEPEAPLPKSDVEAKGTSEK
ncbi:hypothetical protein BROUX41_002271 [Berkeleyomyces rouxiae]|uniref:uncharacterized protein n=1 Tax=Berkeleyomyces rouxiae TaxID=2035830 RepID=UPI003B7F313E